MEFSDNYKELMTILGTSCSTLTLPSEVNNFSHIYSLMMAFDVNKDSCEVPTTAYAAVGTIMLTMASKEIEDITTIVPLSIGVNSTAYAGAETLLRHLCFDRYGNGRLTKVISTKGEVYYGTRGIILDKDFTPLLFSTTKLNSSSDALWGYEVGEHTIHLHPKVFTDTESTINKSLAKKGIAFYLSSLCEELPYKVVIDDCSKYFIRSKMPNVETFSDNEINKTLSENLDVLMSQINL